MFTIHCQINELNYLGHCKYQHELSEYNPTLTQPEGYVVLSGQLQVRIVYFYFRRPRVENQWPLFTSLILIDAKCIFLYICYIFLYICTNPLLRHAYAISDGHPQLTLTTSGCSWQMCSLYEETVHLWNGFPFDLCILFVVIVILFVYIYIYIFYGCWCDEGHWRTGMNVCYDKKIAVLYFYILNEPLVESDAILRNGSLGSNRCFIQRRMPPNKSFPVRQTTAIL